MGVTMNYSIEEFGREQLNESFGEYGSGEINKLTHKIIGACMEVHNTIGRGFLESVYKDCVFMELAGQNLTFEKEKRFDIFYKGVKISHHYFADFIIENK